MRSHDFFSECRNVLNAGALQNLFRVKQTTIYLWGAPPTNEYQQPNPIDRLRRLFAELAAAGRAELGRAAIDMLARPLGGQFAPLSGAKSDKGDLDGEAADAMVSLGRLIEDSRAALADGRVDACETARIRERLRAVQGELEQLFDVIRSFQAMSENKDKERRRAQGADQAAPKELARVVIRFTEDGRCRVNGIPPGFDLAMKVMAEATKAVAGFFIQGAADGKVQQRPGGGGRILTPRIMPSFPPRRN